MKYNFEHKIASECKVHPKAFWSYVNSRTKSTSLIPELLKPDGSKTSSDSEKAEILNNFFSSVFTHDDEHENAPQLETAAEDITPLCSIETTEEEVYKLLSSLDISKSAGPDGIHPRFLQELKDSLTTPITIIFNKSLQEATVPTDWKSAKVVPIFKKGSRASVGNYRPVSLTSVLCKLLEKIIRDRVENHLACHNLLSPYQYGFRKGRNCTTQLLTAMDSWTKSVNDGIDTDIILLDFAKAFDKVPHTHLINKLHHYGIQGNVKLWITDFLSHRQQQTCVNNNFSDFCDVTSGVPQGSVLGPTLFLLYINDLPDCVSSDVLIFADDTKIFRKIHTPDDVIILQKDLDSLFEWSSKWKLCFNASK